MLELEIHLLLQIAGQLAERSLVLFSHITECGCEAEERRPIRVIKQV